MYKDGTSKEQSQPATRPGAKSSDRVGGSADKQVTALRKYYLLTKPGIVYGNALTAAAGYLLASRNNIDFWLLLATLAGLSLVIASGCVFNNYLDREIDKKMRRTRRRAMVTGEISVNSALTYGSILGIAGLTILGAFTNPTALGIALLGLFIYVVVYGYFKRSTVYSTIVGSLAGSAPPAVGYCAARGHFDGGALILFISWALWQMPHFYSIAIYRLKDYRAAGLPVLTVKKGVKRAKLEILSYIVAFILAVDSLSLFGYAGYTYWIVMTGAGLFWLRLGLRDTGDDEFWAKKMFGFSLVITVIWSVMTAIGGRLP